MTKQRPQTPRPSRAPRLTRAGRRAVRSVLAVPPLLFLGATVLYGVRLGRLLLANLSPVVAAEVTRQTGHETRLGRIHFLTPGALALDDVAVASRATFAQGHGEAALSAARLTVHYDLRGLLLDRGNPAHAVGDVVLLRPAVLVERLSPTQFNFSDILNKPQTPKAKPFVGQVIVRDGTLRFRDFLAPAGLGARPALNALAHVNATVNLHSERTAYFAADGQGTAGRLAAFRVSGDSLRLVKGRFRADAQVTDADAAYWTRYFVRSPAVRVTAGRADLDLSAARLKGPPPPGLPVDLTGSVTVRRVALAFADPQLRRLALRELTGGAVLTGGGLAFHATIAADGQPIAGDGTLFDFARPQLALTLTSRRLDVERVARTFPAVRWPAGLTLAPGPATVSVVGPAARPTVSADLALPQVRYAGNQFTQVRAAAVLAGRTLTLPGVALRTAGGGQVALRGTVVLGKTPQVSLAAGARGVDLAALRLPGAKLDLGGLADVQALADNAGHSLRVTANVAVARPRVARTRLLSARARLVYVQGAGLTVSRALIRAPQGAVSVSGTVPTGGRAGRWGLTVDAAGLDLNALAGPYTAAPLGGAAYFQGQVLGPAGAPRAVGQVQLINPRYARFTADVVRGGLAASAGGLRLNDLTLSLFPAEARVSGTVLRLASGDPVLDLGVRLSQADVQDFVNIAGQFAPPSRPAAGRRPARGLAASLPPITGIAQGTFQIGGTARAPRVAGRAILTDATVGPYRVDRLSAQADFGGGAVRVSGVTARVEGATLSARGALGLKTGRIQAAFRADNLDLDRVRALTLPYADLTGVLGVSGRVGGTVKNPSASATLTGRSLTVDGQALAPLTLAARYDDGVLTQTGAPWVLDILPPKPAAPTAPASPDIRYVVSALRLALTTPAHPRRAPSLTLDAALPADAPERVPHLIQTLRASRYAATPAGLRLLTQIDSLPRPLDGALAVPRLAVSGPLAAPTVQATVQADGLTLGADRLGSLTADLRFTGGPDPSGRAGLHALSLLAAGVPVGEITAGAQLAHHVLSGITLRATSANAYLEASGRADLGAGGTLEANLDAGHLPLSLLDVFLPQTVNRAGALTGEVSSLSVSASGLTRSPDLTASVNLAEPGLALTAPADAATHAGPVTTRYALDRVRSGAITLSTPVPGGGQVLTVTDLAAFKGGRPVASLSGTLPFRGRGAQGALPEGQPLHARLLVQDLSLLAPFSPALDPARTAGTLAAGLDVTVLNSSSAADTLRLDGTLDLTGGALGLNGYDTALNKIETHLSLADGVIRLVHPAHPTASDPASQSVTGGVLTVRRFTATSTQGGTVAVTGGGTLERADLRVAASGLTVAEDSRRDVFSRTYGTAFRGKIGGALGVAGPWRTPLISTPDGAPLVVSEASGTVPTGAGAGGAGGGPPRFDPRLGVTVRLGEPGKTVTISNALLRADASGNVELTGRLSDPRLRAHLTVARGQLILPPATRLKFAGTSGSNTVNVRYPVPDPTADGLPGLQTQVDLTAQATVSVSQAQLAAYRPAISSGVGGESVPLVGNTATTATGFSQAQRYTITAHIHGVLNDPHLPIDLESSPAGLSRQDMLIALTGAPGLSGLFGSNAQAALQAELAQALSSVAVPTLLTPLENSIAQSLNLSDFDVAYAPDAPVLVTLSKQLAPRLEATYIRSFGTRTNSTSALGQPPQYTLKLGYGLTRRLQITVSTDDQRNDTIALESVLGF